VVKTAAIPLLVVLVACAAGACGRGALVPAIDLVGDLDRAERRPAGGTFEVVTTEIAGQSMRAIVPPSISRITWETAVPGRAVLKTAVALHPDAWTQEGNGVLFRIGIAEGRTYEELVTRLVDPYHSPDDRRWIPITVDLSAYGGFKWSLFYQPSRLRWRIIFNTNSGPPGTDDRRGDLPLWGEPAIYR
jgi:hypothetical protein